MKIGTNDFVDITNAGGTFITGGYTRVISAAFGSSLSNRPAWSGTIPGYSNVVVSLPAALAGWSVTLDAAENRRIGAFAGVLAAQGGAAPFRAVAVHLCTNYSRGEGFGRAERAFA